jgi:hypothetical protein
MTRWVFVAVGVIALLFLGSRQRFLPPAKADPDALAPPLISAKPVVVLARDNISYTLEKAEVRHVDTRAFVVGRVMKDAPYKITREQFAGATVWVPVDTVTQLIELEPSKPEK